MGWHDFYHPLSCSISSNLSDFKNKNVDLFFLRRVTFSPNVVLVHWTQRKKPQPSMKHRSWKTQEKLTEIGRF